MMKGNFKTTESVTSEQQNGLREKDTAPCAWLPVTAQSAHYLEFCQ